MTTIQDDLLEIYNSLVKFNDETLKSQFPAPIKVWFEPESRMLVFNQKSTTVRLWLANYYSLGLDSIPKSKFTYLLPEDYDTLMWNLSEVIKSGKLLEDRTCLSPENYGFDIYTVDKKDPIRGPQVLGSIRFVSGTGFLFRFLTKLRFNNI